MSHPEEFHPGGDVVPDDGKGSSLQDPFPLLLTARADPRNQLSLLTLIARMIL